MSDIGHFWICLRVSFSLRKYEYLHHLASPYWITQIKSCHRQSSGRKWSCCPWNVLQITEFLLWSTCSFWTTKWFEALYQPQPSVCLLSSQTWIHQPEYHHFGLTLQVYQLKMEWDHRRFGLNQIGSLWVICQE